MRSVTGQYIPKQQKLGAVTAPDGGTDEVIVTATRLFNWQLWLTIALAGTAAYLFLKKPKGRRRLRHAE